MYVPWYMKLDLRHFRDHRHVSLKIGAPEGLSKELEILKHLKAVKTNNGYSALVRTMLDEFQVTGEHGKFQCIVHSPLAVPLSTFRKIFRDRALPLNILKLVLQHLLGVLDFLHTEAKIIHTGQSPRTSDTSRNQRMVQIYRKTIYYWAWMTTSLKLKRH